jgi:hypothetical protein
MAREMKSRQDLEDTVLRKALIDDKFRAELLVDAKGAVERTLSEEAPGSKLPPNLSVKVIEEAPNTLTIVVPAAHELSDAQLEAVSGGIKVKGTVDVG